MSVRDVLRELAQLLRYAEPDGQNIGIFVAEHTSELVQLLRADERELRDATRERDGDLIDRLRERLELTLEHERDRRRANDIERTQRAARELARTARWFELGVVLDADLVFGDLVVDQRTRFVSFTLDDTTVEVPTTLLRAARFLRHTYIDLACFVDERGVHARWHAGIGQLNVYAVEPNVRSDRDAVVVLLPPRAEVQHAVGHAIADVGCGA